MSSNELKLLNEKTAINLNEFRTCELSKNLNKVQSEFCRLKNGLLSYTNKNTVLRNQFIGMNQMNIRIEDNDEDNGYVFLDTEKKKFLNNAFDKNKNVNLANQNEIKNINEYFLTGEQSSITVMETSSDNENYDKNNNHVLNEIVFNDLNSFALNSHKARYQYLKHFASHPSNEKCCNEEYIEPTFVQPTPSSAFFTLQQRKHYQQQHMQHHKDQNAKYLKNRSTIDALDGLIFVLSAIYAKLVVILGLCFPMAEVISHRIPIGWYEGFYLYLYLGSILYLTVIYTCRESSKRKVNSLKKLKRILFWSSLDKEPHHANSLIHENSFTSNVFTASGNVSIHSSCNESDSAEQNRRAHYGSFYLRLGAVAFGIGSMIYSGLEFGQFFELESKEQCYSFLWGFTPTTHMVFTFFQLYFIFMNSKSLIVKHRYISRFGLMHMIATNLCVWLHVLIQETKHQIMIIVYPNKTHDLTSHEPSFNSLMLNPISNNLNSLNPVFFNLTSQENANLALEYLNTTPTILTNNHSLYKRSIEDHEIFTTHGTCRRSNVIGQLVQDASQFLFPCTIEYSLISAAILYIMWKHTDYAQNSNRASSNSENRIRHRSAASTSTVNYQYQKHYYQVDCAKAHKGLFCGIFLLVVCIISLILFFVLIKKPNYKNLGMLQAHVVEIILYSINAIACAIAIMQIKELPYNRHTNVELDNILLIVAQCGLYVFNMFSLIGAHFYQDTSRNTQLVLVNAIACLVQATLQTVFILDASRRCAFNSDQIQRKPGREMVTFLLVCNFSMWAINTLETRRADSNPVQMNFYGFWAWTIITHVTTPLTIFFRFHSTVCLCDIWKKTYKLKTEY